MLAVEVTGINKSFRSGFLGWKKVLKDVNLSIEEGALYGILGPNGAGKTTLISMFCTLLTPDSGKIRVFGLDALRDQLEIRKMVNISSGNPNFSWSLSLYQNLRYYTMLYGMDSREGNQHIERVIELLELQPFHDTRFEALSTGTKQRLSIAKSLLNDPKLLVLDEPTVGLDPDISITIRELIKDIHRQNDVTIILTTHYMREAEELCERIAFLKEGRVIADATPDELKGMVKKRVVIAVEYEGDANLDAVKKVGGVVDLKAEQGRIEVSVSDAHVALDGVLKSLGAARVRNIRIEEPDLEDVFLEFAR